jgi:hypothetical protein
VSRLLVHEPPRKPSGIATDRAGSFVRVWYGDAVAATDGKRTILKGRLGDLPAAMALLLEASSLLRRTP